MQSLNAELHSLYASKWTQLYNSIQPIVENAEYNTKPTNPLLLKVGNEIDYQNADIKLIVFGQETNNWYDDFQFEMESVLDCYDSFFNDEECWSYGGHFWNGFARFLKLFALRYPTKTIYPIWNNIVKIGKYRQIGTPPEFIRKVEKSNFDVIPQELEILKPTIALFLTGPNYDSIINSVFGETKFEKVSEQFSSRQLAQFGLSNTAYAFRTYHPRFLWMNDIDNYFNAVLDQINL